MECPHPPFACIGPPLGPKHTNGCLDGVRPTGDWPDTGCWGAVGQTSDTLASGLLILSGSLMVWLMSGRAVLGSCSVSGQLAAGIEVTGQGLGLGESVVGGAPQTAAAPLNPLARDSDALGVAVGVEPGATAVLGSAENANRCKNPSAWPPVGLGCHTI